jgi:DNA-binding protein H-NS
MDWEYRKIDLNERPRKTDDIDVLMDAGKDGWELVQITPNNIAYLKRMIEDTTLTDDASVNGHGAAVGPEVKAKYRDPATGETWSGRGRMANWLKRKHDAGEDIDDYLV